MRRAKSWIGMAGLALALSTAGAAGEQARTVAALPNGPEAPIAPAPWIQEDPPSREYTAARQALNEGRYQEAAQGFAALRQARPQSSYVADSYYFEAFARSRLGERAQLTRAVSLLDEQRTRFPQAATRADADALRVRIESQLAARGDARAAASVTRQAAAPAAPVSPTSPVSPPAAVAPPAPSSARPSAQAACPNQEPRLAALSALLKMNAERAIPILQEVLRTRDECSVELRRQAVFLVSQHMTEESVDILLDLAHRNPDPDAEVREQAVFWLSQVQTDEAMDALEAILREGTDPELQENAVFAVSQHGSERGVQVLRNLAERADAPRELRENAIFWIGQSRGAGGTRYLIDLYSRLDDEELKENVLFGVSQSDDAQAHLWLVERAMDPAESTETRNNALFWAGQTGALGLAELRQLYGSLDASDQEIKEQVIFVASQNDDAESVDFLMEIARTEQDAELRENAIFWLGQSSDPRVPDLLLQLIRG